MGLGELLHGEPQPGTSGRTIGPAHAYELFSTIAFAGRRRRVFARLVALAGVRPGDDVVDLGCGPGALTRIAARVAGPGGTVLGVDPSPSVIAYAQKSDNPPGCTYALGAAESLDLADSSVDVVLSSLMIHHLPEEVRPMALAQMLRVLRPGGRLVVADFRPPRSALGRHLVGAMTGPAMQDNPIERLEPLVRAAGFEVVDRGDLRPHLHYVRARRPAGA